MPRKGLTVLGRKRIKAAIPHRGWQLLVDSVIIDSNQPDTAIGVMDVREDNPVFKGHYPGNPIYRGIELTEFIAQVCGVLASHLGMTGKPIFSGIDGVKFRGIVRPGDMIVAKVSLLKKKSIGQQVVFSFSGEARNVKDIAGKPCCLVGNLTGSLIP